MVTINILMSTYNGEKFLGEQIDSILNQSKVYTVLSIRDDGSTDRTFEIATEYSRSYPQRVYVEKGENIGYQKSFLKLLQIAMPNADYYAFADQDDVWKQEKCERAVEKLALSKSLIAMYASSLIITDENLCFLYKTDVSKMPNSVESCFTRHRLAGCTIVFTKQLKEIAAQIANNIVSMQMIPSHDAIVASAAFLCGEVTLDKGSYILHRRHNKSVTSGGRGVLNRIKTEINVLFIFKRRCSSLAKLLLKSSLPYKCPSKQSFLYDVANYSKSMRGKAKLLFNPKMTSGNVVIDLETKLKILLSTY